MPQIAKSIPTKEIPFRMLGKVLWYPGISILSRFAHTRSPKTDFEAQFLVDFALGNSTGLKNIQASDIIPGMRHHQPIQTRLQKARTIKGSTEYLVHTLQGLACFIQFSSLSLNILAILFSSDMACFFSGLAKPYITLVNRDYQWRSCLSPANCAYLCPLRITVQIITLPLTKVALGLIFVLG
jgi:hypothetical protein